MRITDEGGGREIAEAETPDLEAKLEGLQKPRGWGLFLIENMVDDLRVIDATGASTRSSSSCGWKEGTMAATEFAAQRAPRGRRRGDRARPATSSGTAEQTLARAPTPRPAAEPVVLLDFADVDYINSTGIALIVGLLAQARTSGQDVRARGLAEHYREIFRDHAALGLHDHPRRRGGNGHDRRTLLDGRAPRRRRRRA